MRSLGRQVIVEFYGVAPDLGADSKRIESVVVDALSGAGAQVVSASFNTFPPTGTVGSVVLESGQAGVFAAAEVNFLSVTLFDASAMVDLDAAVAKLEDVLGAERVSRRDLPSGEGVVADSAKAASVTQEVERAHRTWFTEFDDGMALSLELDGEMLFHDQSDFQDVKVFDTTRWGRVLTLDDYVMLTTRDECVYHEMMTHPACLTHPNPKRALVIGGGDGGTVRELAKHTSIEEIVMVEIDGMVVDACRKFIPETACGMDHPKCNLIIGDGIAYVEEAEPESFDIICVDSTDPLGPSQGLFTEKFYRKAHSMLRPQGILMVQSESPRTKIHVFQEIYTFFDAIFGRENVHCMMIHVPTYMPGTWSLAFCSKGPHPVADVDQERQTKFVDAHDLNYYNESMHQGAFALPSYVRKLLGHA
ncbi:MAG: polyamine aminopropyltransferase [Myxococcota bacterium]|nr:polyamine aminopropyltransferase [Myxococcota bacterium]